MGENVPSLNWAYSIPVNDKACKIVQVNGINIAQTERNYYYGKSTDQKIHYKTMSAEGSSAEFYRDLYVEIYPGLYCYSGICTDTNLTEKLEQAANKVKSLQDRDIENWRQTLSFLN